MTSFDDLRGCSFAAVVENYLASEHFANLAPITQTKRRGLFRHIIAVARNEIPPGAPARSAPWRPAHQRRNWRTA
jgi:hypothetical protein